MAKTLKQFKELYTPKSADEKKFVDKHVVKKNKDRNGNDDKLFNASNIKPTKRATAHGYETSGEHDDEKVYEETNIEEKHLTPAEMKKREEVAKAIEREHPGMAKPKKMAIATATAKKVAEDVEQVEEAEKVAAHRPGWMLRSDKKLGDATKQAKKMNQLMAKHGGKPEAGKSVKEEAAVDESLGMTMSPNFKPWTPSKGKKWKVVHSSTGKARGEWDEPVGAVKHLKGMSPDLQKVHKIVKEDQQIDELSAETRKSYLLKAAPMNRANPTKKRSMGIKRALFAPKASTQTEEVKNVVDKSGAVHTPMSRTRHLARMALKKQIEKHAKEAAADVVKKKTNEEVNYDDIRQYLLSVYEGKLDQEEQQILNEMLETEDGAKLAFVITYFSGE